MAFTVTSELTAAGSNTDATSYTTASVSVTAGDFLVAIVSNGVAAQPAEVISQIVGTLGSTLTWTDQGSVLMNSSLVVRTSIWTAQCPSTASGTLTFDFGGANTQSNCQWQVYSITAGGTISVVNVETQQTAATNPSMTISPSPGASQMVIGAMNANVSTAAVQGAGWTLGSAGTSQTSPASRTAVQYDTTSPSATFNWTLASATNKAQIALTLEESTDIQVAVDTAALTLSGVDPTSGGTGSATLTTDVAALVLAGVNPAASGTGTATSAVDPAALLLTGVDVAADTGATVVPVDPAALVLSGQTPALSGSGAASVTVDAATLTLGAQTPTSSGTGTATANADPAVLTLTGQTPTAAGTGTASVAVDVSVLVLSGVEVLANGGGAAVAVDPAILNLTGQTPAFTATGTATATVDAAALVVVGVNLGAVGSGTAGIVADSATLTLVGATPALTGSGVATVAAEAAVLTLTGVEVIPAGQTPDANPTTLTIHDRGHTASVRTPRTTVTVAAPRTRVTARPSTSTTIREQH